MRNFNHERWGFVVQANRFSRVLLQESFAHASRRNQAPQPTPFGQCSYCCWPFRGFPPGAYRLRPSALEGGRIGVSERLLVLSTDCQCSIHFPNQLLQTLFLPPSME